MKKSLFIYLSIFLVLLILDQWSKIYIKTNFYLGQEIIVIPNWFRITFTENPGAAFGMEYGGELGKYFLTLFRIFFSIILFYYLIQKIKEGTNKVYLLAITFILSGAVGNAIDGVFYGVFFSESSYFSSSVAHFVPMGKGYAGWLQGKVVDMLYFPIIESTFPKWLPIVGGDPFLFFSPIFNIADSCISVGLVLAIFVINKVKI